MDIELGVLALGVLQHGLRHSVGARRGIGRQGPGMEDGRPVVRGPADGDGDVVPLLAGAPLDGEGATLPEEALRTACQFVCELGDRAVGVPDHRGDRVPDELVAGRPVRRGQAARLEVHQVRRQHEARLGALLDVRQRGAGARGAGPPYRP
ncbi:hypothetical protein ACIF9R_07730 [Streptomyces sp. NPDC086080]|uniref:hypothetical protein n=1 Tax=Streptomyces sp. NPDC086080 TaxID=3365748 RepID=UPI0037CD57C5